MVENLHTPSPPAVSFAWLSILKGDSEYLSHVPLPSLTDSRRRLRYKQRAKSKTPDQVFEITKTRNLLTHSIRQYHDCRKVYVPGLASIDQSEESSKLESQPEVLKLWLPSQLPAEGRSAWCLPGIPGLELRFRYAQADDTLSELRRHIRLLHLARDQNAKHTKSTASTTRSQGILDGFRGKIKRLASEYRDARQALVALDPTQTLAPDWGRYFLLLDDRDLRAPARDESQPSEGKVTYSWIWTTAHPPPLSLPLAMTLDHTPQATTSASPSSFPALIDSADPDVVSQDFERVQWAKCQARVERYEEEVQLTVEEMGRTLRYFEWRRDWWISLVPERTGSDCLPDIRSGFRSYAHRQSYLYNELVTSFVSHWRPYLSSQSLGSSWLSKYASRVRPTPARSSRKAGVPGTACTPTLLKPSTNVQPPIDPPLRSESDDDSDGEVGAGGDPEDNVDAEDILDDD